MSANWTALSPLGLGESLLDVIPAAIYICGTSGVKEKLHRASEVDTANDGREAIASIARAEALGRPFDVVIMDMQMPVMDGFETTRHLRQAGFQRPSSP